MLSSYIEGPSLPNQRVPNSIIFTFDSYSTWVPSLTSVRTSFYRLYTTHHHLSRKICHSFLSKIIMHVRSETCIRICSDSQETLKALQAAQTMSPLVWQCQRALNDISTHHTVGLFWVPKTFWNMWKWNCWWAHKGGICSPVCWTGTNYGGLQAEYKED
jgi:hypothetical protein